MKVLLIQPPWYGFQNIVSTRLYLGLAYLAAVLEKNGDEVVIFNGETFFDSIEKGNENIVIDEEVYLKNFSSSHTVYAKIMEATRDFKPDLAGISFMTANATSAYILAKMLKESHPSLPLIAGGPHPTLLPEEPFNRSVFDYIVRGEGEETIIELVETIKNKKDVSSIKGLSYRKNGQIIHNDNRPFIENLDSLPFPAFHLMHDAKKYQYACTGITSSRGCPFECIYCASKLLWTRAVRSRSPANVVAEIKHRHERLGVTLFAFSDDTFTFKSAFVEDFCRRVLDLHFKIKWYCDTRGDTVDLRLLKLMKKAGCDHIYLGLETGSPKIQKLIKKNISNEKVCDAIKMARQAGIETTVYFMVGFPDETEEDIWESIQAMRWINPDHALWSILTPYPGTGVWQIAQDRGLVSKDTNWDSFFHHFNQNIFNTIPKETWNKTLAVIREEQVKLDKKLTKVKLRKKIADKLSLLKLAINNPARAIAYVKKKISLH